MDKVCWKCGGCIDDQHPSDGVEYASQPNQYAHKECPGLTVVANYTAPLEWKGECVIKSRGQS